MTHPADRRRIDIITIYRAWLHECGLADRTIHHYCRVIGWLSAYLREQDTQLLDATQEQLRAWRASRTVHRDTMIDYIGIVKAFYKWAHRSELIARDPAWNIPTGRKRRRLPRPIGEDALLVAIENAPNRIRPWLVLAAFEGLRACEIADLRREDIYDSGPDPVMIIHGKGDKERTIPLSPYVWSELLAAGLPSRGPLFRRRDCMPGPNTAKRVSDVSNDYLRAMGITETLHQLRHRFGTVVQRTGKDIRVTQELMGHSDPKTTAGYAAYSKPEAQAIVLAIQPKPRGGGGSLSADERSLTLPRDD